MKKLTYKVDEALVHLEETMNNQDFEFILRTKSEDGLKRLHQVRKFFESDKIYTDVLFYSREDHSYQVIVRQDSYMPFVLGLFRSQLLTEMSWDENE